MLKTSRDFLSGWLALSLALFVSTSAFADKVVVLQFEGDDGNRVHNQVVQALRAAGEVKVVPLSKYKESARRRKVVSDRAMSPAGVAKVAPGLGLSAIIWGAVRERFEIRIFDSRGEELWAKDLPVANGAISKKHAVKLARAIATAAQTGSSSATTSDDSEQDESDANQFRTETSETAPSSSPESLATSGNEAPFPPAGRTEEELTDIDLSPDNAPKKTAVAPKVFSFSINGSTTWRQYCARPGVKKCEAYDAMNESSRPRGDTVDFSPKTPYGGFSAAGTLLPLALSNNLARGLGLAGSYSQGFSQTNVRVVSTQGDGPGTNVVSIEQHIELAGLYRFYFPLNLLSSGNLAYVGLKGGYNIRRFTVDPKATVPLPSSSRAFPLAGLELSIPLAKVFRLEGAGFYLFSPRPSENEVKRYGDIKGNSGGVESSGWGYEAGIAGDIWGPIGYSVRFKVQSFADTFNGAGEAWPCSDGQCGGAAAESFTAIHGGLTASF